MNPLVLSFIVLTIVGAAFVLVIVNEIRKKKAGKSSCGSCSGCPMSGKCHASKENKK